MARREEGSTEQLIETLGFPENSVNGVVRHLTDILTQGSSIFLLSCVFCNVVFSQAFCCGSANRRSVLQHGFASLTHPGLRFHKADGHVEWVLQGVTECTSLKEMSSVP